MKRKNINYFGTVVFPDDSDPRWIKTPYSITQEFSQSALPVGTIIHPSGYAYMTDINLWKKIRDERETILEQQRKIMYERQLEEEKLQKLEEKKAKEEYQILLKQQKEIKDKLQKLQDNYEREIRMITRKVDIKYNPEINKLQKQLKQVNKIIR